MSQSEFFKYLNSGVITLGIHTLNNLIFTKECEILDGDLYHTYRYNHQTNQWELSYSLNTTLLDELA